MTVQMAPGGQPALPGACAPCAPCLHVQGAAPTGEGVRRMGVLGAPGWGQQLKCACACAGAVCARATRCACLCVCVCVFSNARPHRVGHQGQGAQVLCNPYQPPVRQSHRRPTHAPPSPPGLQPSPAAAAAAAAAAATAAAGARGARGASSWVVLSTEWDPMQGWGRGGCSFSVPACCRLRLDHPPAPCPAPRHSSPGCHSGNTLPTPTTNRPEMLGTLEHFLSRECGTTPELACLANCPS